MVKNALEIYTDEIDEKEHTILLMREILDNFFKLFNLTKIKIPENIIDIFKKQIINYFDIIGYKCIKLWLVNIENIFKYFIKIYRLLKILIILCESQHHEHNKNDNEYELYE